MSVAASAIRYRPPMATQNDTTYIALLRGINVGGKNKLPMKQLAKLCEDIGCDNVRTYIQSGNVLLRAPARLADAFADQLTDRIQASLNLSVPVVVRSARELRNVVAGNPFIKAGADESALHVVFLADKPPKQQVAALDPNRSPGDEFIVKGREIYLRLPNGAGNSKLTNAYFDSKLGAVSTARNWRTVLKLLELAEE